MHISHSLSCLVVFITTVNYALGANPVRASASPGVNTPTFRNAPKTTTTQAVTTSRAAAGSPDNGFLNSDALLRELVKSNKHAITLPGGPNVYIPTGTMVPSISASDMDLVIETNNAGAFLYMASDLQDKVQQALEQNCQDGATSRCKDAINGVVHQPRVALEARNPIIYAIAVVVGGITIWIENYLHGQPPPKVVHFPPEILSSMSDAVTAGGGRIEDISITLPISNPPKTITGEPPTFSTYTTLSGTHSKGDVVLSLPTNLVLQAQDILDRTDLFCPFQRMKRQLSVGCVASAGENLVMNPGMHDLMLINNGGMLPRAPEMIRGAQQVAAFATAQARLLRVSPWAAATFGLAAFAIAWQNLINGQEISNEMYFPESDFNFSPQAISSAIEVTQPPSLTTTGTTSKTSCSTPLICQSPICDGHTQTQLCSAPKWKGCDCTNEASKTGFDYFDKTLADLQFSFWPSIIASMEAKPGPTPSCSIEHAPIGFNGKPAFTPSNFCFCSQTPDPIHSVSWTAGNFPTLTTGESACHYTSLPSSGISFRSSTFTGRPGHPNSCRTVSSTITAIPAGTTTYTTSLDADYCTCNDGGVYGFATMTRNLVCPIQYCPDSKPPSGRGSPSVCQQGPSDDPCDLCFVGPDPVCRIRIREHVPQSDGDATGAPSEDDLSNGMWMGFYMQNRWDETLVNDWHSSWGFTLGDGFRFELLDSNYPDHVWLSRDGYEMKFKATGVGEWDMSWDDDSTYPHVERGEWEMHSSEWIRETTAYVPCSCEGCLHKYGQ